MRAVVDGKCRRASRARTSSDDHRRDRHRRAAPAMCWNMPARRSARYRWRPHDVCNMVDRGRRPRRLIAPTRRLRFPARPANREGRGMGRAMRYWERCARMMLRISTMRSGGRGEAAADRDLGHLAGKTSCPVTGTVPDPDRSRTKQAPVEASRAELYGPEGRHQDHRYKARPRLIGS